MPSVNLILSVVKKNNPPHNFTTDAKFVPVSMSVVLDGNASNVINATNGICHDVQSNLRIYSVSPNTSISMSNLRVLRS